VIYARCTKIDNIDSSIESYTIIYIYVKHSSETNKDDIDINKILTTNNNYESFHSKVTGIFL